MIQKVKFYLKSFKNALIYSKIKDFYDTNSQKTMIQVIKKSFWNIEEAIES